MSNEQLHRKNNEKKWVPKVYFLVKINELRKQGMRELNALVVVKINIVCVA